MTIAPPLHFQLAITSVYAPYVGCSRTARRGSGSQPSGAAGPRAARRRQRAERRLTSVPLVLVGAPDSARHVALVAHSLVYVTPPAVIAVGPDLSHAAPSTATE